MGLVGPLPTAPGNLRYTVVAVEYFTKWIEAKPLATRRLLKNSSGNKSYAALECQENSHWTMELNSTANCSKSFACKSEREYHKNKHNVRDSWNNLICEPSQCSPKAQSTRGYYKKSITSPRVLPRRHSRATTRRDHHHQLLEAGQHQTAPSNNNESGGAHTCLSTPRRG
jgi:hypothetical protein